jgi:hypothetical protein
MLLTWNQKEVSPEIQGCFGYKRTLRNIDRELLVEEHIWRLSS